MNGGVWNRLLDLETLRWGEQGVRLGLERHVESWAWAIIIVAALVVAGASYYRLAGSTAWRSALAITRALLLVVLALLLAGPRLVKTEESIERDWVLALVDRSLSMSIEDAADANDSQRRRSRDTEVRQAIARSWPAWQDLAADREVVWMGFAGGAYEIGPTEDGAALALGDATGRRTAIGAAIEQALDRAAARPVSAIVVFSDGRSEGVVPRRVLRRAQAERIPIHTVGLGSTIPMGDLAIRRVDAPTATFTSDVTPVRVDLARVGGAGPMTATARLVDALTGEVFDKRRVELPAPAGGESTGVVTLVHRAETTGSGQWRVEIEPDGVDLLATNNVQDFEIELVDRPMRVLYIDGYPRWERRYLSNLLLREASIRSSSLMLAADRRYTQEGDVKVDDLPDSPELWAEYDVVVLGDVRPDVFTWDQLQQLRDHVAERGGGLLWIGGPAQTPRRWWDTPLGELLPFARPAAEAPLGEPFTLTPTPAAERVGVMRLAEAGDQPWPAELSDPTTGWSVLHWGQDLGAGLLKPTAESLVDGVGVYTQERVPIVVSMRFGAGKVTYAATDEIWRYRYGLGERLYERFWVQLIRMLGREGLSRAGRSAVLSVGSGQAGADDPVHIEVELLDQALVDLDLASIEARLIPEDDDTASRPTTVRLTRDHGEQRLFSGSWIAGTPGRWRVEISDVEFAGAGLAATIDVGVRSDELRDPETDHEGLRALSDATGGRLLATADIDELFGLFPNRRERRLTEVSETLWDTPLALIVVLSLLTAEWVGRRVIRLI